MQWEDRIGRRVKLRDLHTLMAVVERGSMAKAARDLAVSQPVVSKTIADLEHTLGVRLLDRGRQGAEPTPYGRALLRRGLAAFDELRQGVKEIEFLTDPTAGEVRVGGLEAMIGGLLPVVIDRVRRRHPRLTVRVKQTITSSALYEDVRERSVDFMIGRMLSRSLDKDLMAEVLFDEPLFVAAGVRSRWASRRKLALQDLMDEPWILSPPETAVGALHAEVFHACGLELPPAAVVHTSIQLTVALLATGNFLALVPGSLLMFSTHSLAIKVLPVPLPIRPGPVGIVTLRNRTLSPAAQLFIACIREVAKPLASRPSR
jgi:DNA-binding transcriptional LysR family regulator